jgi:hypothetical protein
MGVQPYAILSVLFQLTTDATSQQAIFFNDYNPAATQSFSFNISDAL